MLLPLLATLCCCFCFCRAFTVFPTSTDLLPEMYLSTVEAVRRDGYPGEKHSVKTSDGYLLEVHRIAPGGRRSKAPTKRYPVILQHGILCTSFEWVNNGPRHSFGYMLADAGYDVWLANSRGNSYSRKHERLSPKSKKFWEFSWDDMAAKDLPAVIDFVLDNTNSTQVYIVGHSMGTTISFALLAELPQYNRKVKALFAVSPVTTLTHVDGLIRLLANMNGLFKLLREMGCYEFFPRSFVYPLLGETICNGPLVVVCESVLLTLFGDKPGCLNQTRFPVYISHFPAGTSVHVPIHYFQIHRSNKFTKYDWGKKRNMIKFGQPKPPEYDLRNVKTEVHLYYIDGDLVSSERDVLEISGRLGGVAARHRVVQRRCGHLWLIWGMETASSLYRSILRQMNSVP